MCGTFRDIDGQRFTRDRSEMADWLTDASNSGRIIYATNLFYDWTSVFGGFPASCKALFAGARLIRIHWPVPGKRIIRYYDTSNLTNRMSVGYLGKMVGLTKLATPPILIQPESGALRPCDIHPVRMVEIEKYNRLDAEITYQWALRFQSVCKELGCEVKTTIASTGLDLWKRRYMEKGLFSPPGWVNDYLREAYHGGLVFVFKRGLGKEVTYYDIHSLYPFVLSSRPYPDSSSMRWLRGGGSIDQILDYEGFSRVRVRYPACYFPILPVVVRGTLITCTGDYGGFWTHVELREAMKRGAEILDVHETIYFTRTVAPLKAYMLDLYECRRKAILEGDSFEAVYKLFMNALSGKFGQRSDNSLYEPVDVDCITDPADLEGIVTLVAGALEYYVRPRVTHYEPDFINVSWAAYMTAYARLREIEYLEEAFPDVFACDTDSVFTTYRYEEGNDLGDMGVKTPSADWIFLYPKQYANWATDGSWSGKIKGVPRGGQSAYFRQGSYTWTKPATFKEAVREGVVPGDWIERTRTDRVKHDKRVYFDSIDPYSELTDSRPLTYDEAVEYYAYPPRGEDWRISGTLHKTDPLAVSMEALDRIRIQWEIDSLREACIIPATTIFALWDYKRGEMRAVTSRSGIRTTWEYAKVDDMATEHGYPDARTFVAAIEAQVGVYAQIRMLRSRL